MNRDREMEGMEREKARIAGQIGEANQCDTRAGCDTVSTGRSIGPASPSRYELRQRRQKLIEELMLLDACLSNWTDDTDRQISFARDLRMLGYFI